jgi:hypothetical protein
MPYNPGTQSIVIVSKKHHAMLKELALKNRRTLQAQLELLIEKDYKK